MGGGGGVLRISSDGDDQRILGALKFSIPELFWVGKFGKYFLCGLSFLNLYICFRVISFNPFRKFLRHGIFWGSIFGQRIFLLGFLGFLFCPHSIIPVTWSGAKLTLVYTAIAKATETVSSILKLALITKAQEIRKFHLIVYREMSKRTGSSPKI